MLKRLFINRFTLTVAGFVLFAAFIWYAGPLFAFAQWHPLEPINHRLWLIGGFLLMLILPPILRWIIRGVLTRKLITDMKRQAQTIEIDTEEEVHPDVIAMNKRFTQAIDQLKKQPNQKSLYQLPWYIIIGPPGTGKTTAIRNSGLTFPLDNYDTQEGLQGIGGTRHCQWWFTKEAILIDTAGRYFTQDSDQHADQTEWKEFLSLLQNYRRRRPINGALITLSVDELLNTSRDERLKHAQTIKARINELYSILKIRVPVYFLVTKADEIPGFNLFFEQLRHDERAQVWGFTLPQTITSAALAKTLNTEFETLLSRLNQHVLERIQAEADINQRHELLDFPHHLASYQTAICSLLRDLFTDVDCEEQALLRGVYLTSGTQDSTALDRMVSRMPSPVVAMQQHTEGKGYFLNHLFTKIIFPESGLVGHNLALEKKLQWFNRFSIAGAALVFALLFFGVAGMYLHNNAFITANENSLQRIKQPLEQYISRHLSDGYSTLNTRVEILNNIASLPSNASQKKVVSYWHQLSNLGLSQRSKLSNQSYALYDSATVNLLMPEITSFLGETMRNTSLNKDQHYQALKTYIMLMSEQQYDKKSVYDFLDRHWFKSVDLSEDKKASLVSHVEYLLEQYKPAQRRFTLDNTLIAETRSHLLNEPIDESIYKNLKSTLTHDTTEEGLQPFTLYSALGGINSERLFIRKSKESMRDGIPPLFTKIGHYAFTAKLDTYVKNTFSERQWVLFPDSDAQQNTDDIKSITENITNRYQREYIQHYKTLLNDLTLAPFDSSLASSERLKLLSDPEKSPLLLLINHLDEETNFDKPLLGIDTKKSVKKLNKYTDNLLSKLGISGVKNSVKPNSPITDAFAPLTQFAASSEEIPPNTIAVLDLIANLQGYLQLVAATPPPLPIHVTEQGQEAIQNLNVEAQGMPAPLQSILTAAASQASGKAQKNIRAYINESWSAQTYPYCSKAIANRYPIVASNSSVTLDDFGRFFGYGGVVDTFFNAQLLPYVDISPKTWRNKQAGANSIALSTSGLSQLQHADQIKRAFFPYGTDKPSVRFSMTPRPMNKDIAESKITVGGQALTYQHGPQSALTMTWPGENTDSVLELKLFDGRTLFLRETGDWGLFKLINKGTLTKKGNNETFSLVFNVDGYAVEYDLTALSAFNPFQLNALTQFQCKKRL